MGKGCYKGREGLYRRRYTCPSSSEFRPPSSFDGELKSVNKLTDWVSEALP